MLISEIENAQIGVCWQFAAFIIYIAGIGIVDIFIYPYVSYRDRQEFINIRAEKATAYIDFVDLLAVGFINESDQ